MKKIITTTIATGLVAGIASAQVSVTLDLASAYVFRGVTLNDGAVLQPGIEVAGLGMPEEWGAVVVGAWGSYDLDDYDPSGAVGSSFQESDWYGSYSLPALVDGLDLYVGYCEYSYGAGSSDKEANIGAGYEVAGVGLGLTYYQGVGGAISTSSYIEFALGYGIDFTEEFSGEIGARFGFADPDGGKSGFSDYDVGAAVSYALTEQWSLGASVMYIGQGDDDVLGDYDPTAPAGEGAGYDVEALGMISLACEM